MQAGRKHVIACITAGAKTGWNLAWQTMVKELAPQDKTGSYNRPGYAFDNKIGSPQFPVSDAGRELGLVVVAAGLQQ
jgi:hypothetical protein